MSIHRILFRASNILLFVLSEIMLFIHRNLFGIKIQFSGSVI